MEVGPPRLLGSVEGPPLKEGGEANKETRPQVSHQPLEMWRDRLSSGTV